MSAHRINADLDNVLRARFADVDDPGAGGTITIEHQGFSICRVTTAGAESRVLEDADNFFPGHRLLVLLETAGGNLTIDSDDADVVLTAAGQFAEFVVTPTSSSTNVWRIVSSSVIAGAIPASAGTYEFLETETAADAVAGILTILAALESAGLIDASGITQATS